MMKTMRRWCKECRYFDQGCYHHDHGYPGPYFLEPSCDDGPVPRDTIPETHEVLPIKALAELYAAMDGK